MVELRYYSDSLGREPFLVWRADLKQGSCARIDAALLRMKEGNFSQVKGLGGGLLEYRLHFGPGYRIYFGREGQELVILLAGGVKASQQRDINKARAMWQDYKNQGRASKEALGDAH